MQNHFSRAEGFRLGVVLTVVCVMLVGCAAEVELGGPGTPCLDGTSCMSGLCHPSERICTEECSAAMPCAPVGGSPRICSAAGICSEPCDERAVVDAGAGRQICADGVFVACSTRDAIADCDVCGCEPFGGGACLTGRGCVMPQADGATCTVDAECMSGLCYRDTNVCGAPRAQGEPCVLDVDCETDNCSTDGDETSTGTCLQAFETECDGFGMTATCNDCMRFDSILGSVCARERCDPVDAPCPQLGDPRRVWSCERSMDGVFRCFERCDPTTGYRCFEDSRTCRSSGFCG